MFETVAPETFQTRSRRLFYETLPVSLALHALAIGAGVAATLWQVGFPEASPRVSVPYRLILIPDPPPPPQQPPAAKPATPSPAKVTPPPPAPIALAQEAAPTVIPDRIPVIVEPPPIPVPQPIAVEAPIAKPSGGGQGTSLAGELAGKLHGTPGGIIFPDGRLHVDRDEKLPMEPIDQQYPHYPHEAQKKGLEDQVIVRYIIGTDGRIKDIQILDHAKEKMFDEAAVDAIRGWRFHPMVKDGKRVEVVHELAINFQLVSR